MQTKWERFIVHHTATADTRAADIQNIRRFHTNVRGWRDIGYHFVIGRLGSTYEAKAGRPLYMSGAHTRGKNSDSIGVAFVGNFHLEYPDKEQIEVGAQLIAGLSHSIGIDPLAIYPHRDFSATACPGRYFPMDLLIRLVKKYLDSA